MPRQPLVDERVVRRHRSSTLRSSRTMLSKNSSVSRWNACRRLSSKSGKSLGVRRRCRAGCAASSHWPAKLSTSASRPRIGEHPAHLLLEHRRRAPAALARHVEELVVRDAAPEEERQPGRQLEIADAMHGAGAAGGRIALDRGRGTPGSASSRRSATLDAGLEAPLRAGPASKKAHQRLHVVVGDRPPIGAAGQRRRESASRTAALVASARGPAA